MMTLVALGFERCTMAFRTRVVIAHTHHLVGGIESALTRRRGAFRFSVLGHSHITSLTVATRPTVVP